MKPLSLLILTFITLLAGCSPAPTSMYKVEVVEVGPKAVIDKYYVNVRVLATGDIMFGTTWESKAVEGTVLTAVCWKEAGAEVCSGFFE